MIIKDATAADLPTIVSLAHRIWPVTYGEILSAPQLTYMLDLFYTTDKLSQSMQNGHRYLLVEDGEPVGFAGYEHHYQGQPVTRLHKIYVLPQTQGKGVGKTLLGHVEQLARAQGSNALSLNVNRHNNALGFYKKQGFKIVAGEDIDIGHGYLMEDYRMEKPL